MQSVGDAERRGVQAPKIVEHEMTADRRIWSDPRAPKRLSAVHHRVPKLPSDEQTKHRSTQGQRRGEQSIAELIECRARRNINERQSSQRWGDCNQSD